MPTESLMRGFPREATVFPPGFHTRVQTRWVPRAADAEVAIWFHLPMALVDGEHPSPLQCAFSLADFTNAVANISAGQRARSGPPYTAISADADGSTPSPTFAVAKR